MAGDGRTHLLDGLRLCANDLRFATHELTPRIESADGCLHEACSVMRPPACQCRVKTADFVP